MEAVDLCTLDLLPPGCGVIASFDETTRDSVAGSPGCMATTVEVEEDARFQATRRRRLHGKWVQEKSDWSGWFSIADCPIVLTWESFWSS